MTSFSFFPYQPTLTRVVHSASSFVAGQGWPWVAGPAMLPGRAS